MLVLLLQCRSPALFFPKIKANSIKISILTKNSRIPKFHFCIVAFAPHLPFTGLTFDSCNYCLRLPLALPACLPWLGSAWLALLPLSRQLVSHPGTEITNNLVHYDSRGFHVPYPIWFRHSASNSKVAASSSSLISASWVSQHGLSIL